MTWGCLVLAVLYQFKRFCASLSKWSFVSKLPLCQVLRGWERHWVECFLKYEKSFIQEIWGSPPCARPCFGYTKDVEANPSLVRQKAP